MKRKTVVFSLLLAGTLLASAPAVAAPLYDGWSAVTPTVTDPVGDAPPGLDITGIRHASVGGDHFFRMDVMGPIPIPGNSYTLFALNAPPAPDYIFSSTTKPITDPNIISFTKTFTNDTNSEDATSRFRYTNNGNGSFFLEWSLENDAALNSVFYLAGKTGVGTATIDTTSMAATPIPGAAWLFVSGILGLIGIKRKNHAA